MEKKSHCNGKIMHWILLPFFCLLCPFLLYILISFWFYRLILAASYFEIYQLSFRYILIYPQGCDVCNHLSLFLCVANHDKLLPGRCIIWCIVFDSLQFVTPLYIFNMICFYSGWSHFAQFTIAVINRDPKKSKYSGEFNVTTVSLS